MTVTNAITEIDEQLTASFAMIRERLSRLGLNLMLWNGQPAAESMLSPRCALCRTLYDAGHPCCGEGRAVAEQVVRTRQRAWTLLPSGCCVIGAPLYRRRRIIGAATACFPAQPMLEEESLARLCDRLKLDRQAVEVMVRRDGRRAATDAEELAGMLEWLLQEEQAHQTARQELQYLSANLSATYEELSLLYRISRSMRVTREPADFLHTVCEELLDVVHIEAAAAIEYAHLVGSDHDTLVIAGELDLEVDDLRYLLKRVIAPRFRESNQPILSNEGVGTRTPGGRSVHNFIAVPLVNEDKRIGILVGFNKIADDFDSVDLKLLGSISNQASVFLANNRLYADMQDLLMGVLHALTATIDAKDPYTSGHSQRVALFSQRIAEEMGLDETKIEQIYLAGLLHDIGKIGVPEAVLAKPGKLTDDEFGHIRRHPSIGARILGGIRQLDTIISGVLTHHERADGRGYPGGLAGDAVPIEGRIIGLADALDAMTSDRTYRAALPLEKVVEELRRNAGTQFDPEATAAFLKIDLAALLQEVREAAETVFPVNLYEERNS
ncbi:MAG: HD domain-containing protein [Phycisphaerae bacterium]|nr:HD domain-containing protein [Phycisphaerae bacterium]